MALRVEVVYALPEEEDSVFVELSKGMTVIDAVTASGMLARHAEIDLRRCKLGIYGRLVGEDQALVEGDRLEIYRPLAVDPKEARRRRALKKAQSRR